MQRQQVDWRFLMDHVSVKPAVAAEPTMVVHVLPGLENHDEFIFSLVARWFTSRAAPNPAWASCVRLAGRLDPPPLSTGPPFDSVPPLPSACRCLSVWLHTDGMRAVLSWPTLARTWERPIDLHDSAALILGHLVGASTDLFIPLMCCALSTAEFDSLVQFCIRTRCFILLAADRPIYYTSDGDPNAPALALMASSYTKVVAQEDVPLSQRSAMALEMARELAAPRGFRGRFIASDGTVHAIGGSHASTAATMIGTAGHARGQVTAVGLLQTLENREDVQPNDGSSASALVASPHQQTPPSGMELVFAPSHPSPPHSLPHATAVTAGVEAANGKVRKVRSQHSAGAMSTVERVRQLSSSTPIAGKGPRSGGKGRGRLPQVGLQNLTAVGSHERARLPPELRALITPKLLTVMADKKLILFTAVVTHPTGASERRLVLNTCAGMHDTDSAAPNAFANRVRNLTRKLAAVCHGVEQVRVCKPSAIVLLHVPPVPGAAEPQRIASRLLAVLTDGHFLAAATRLSQAVTINFLFFAKQRV